MPYYEPWAVVVGAHVESSARYASYAFVSTTICGSVLTRRRASPPTVPDDGALTVGRRGNLTARGLVYKTHLDRYHFCAAKARVVLGCLPVRPPR